MLGQLLTTVLYISSFCNKFTIYLMKKTFHSNVVLTFLKLSTFFSLSPFHCEVCTNRQRVAFNHKTEHWTGYLAQINTVNTVRLSSTCNIQYPRFVHNQLHIEQEAQLSGGK